MKDYVLELLDWIDAQPDREELIPVTYPVLADALNK